MKTKLKSILVVSIMANTINLLAQFDDGGDHMNYANAEACIPAASPWHLGGDNIAIPWGWNPFSVSANGPNPIFDIGTCNDFPFVLKSNNFPSVWVTQSGNTGINNASPRAALDVSHPTIGQKSNFKIFGDLRGNVESSVDMRLHFANGNNFYVNEGNQNTNTNHLAILSGGNVGIGESAPSVKLEVMDKNGIPGSYLPLLKLRRDDWSCTQSSGIEFWNGGLHTDATAKIVSKMEICGADGESLIFETRTANQTVCTPKMTINNAGQVWVKQRPTSGSHANFDFAAPKIVANEIYVFTTGAWADYVFDKNYKLPKLSDVEKYYTENHHLPEIPCAAEVEKDGINVSQMNALLLKKVEELTLYVVQLQKQVDNLENK